MFKRIIFLTFLLSSLFSANDTLNITITIVDTPLSTDENISPTEFIFHPASPNPFNNQVLLRWDLDHSGKVDLLIFDLLGREVMHKTFNNLEPGRYKTKWNGLDDNGRNIGAGIFMVQLKTSQKSSVQKIILLN